MHNIGVVVNICVVLGVTLRQLPRTTKRTSASKQKPYESRKPNHALRLRIPNGDLPVRLRVTA